MRRLLLAASFFSFLVSAPLFAWGEKGHTISNEAATFGTPAAMPLFFHKAYPRLVYLANDPDRWRGGGESIDAVNAPDHFLDYEYVKGLKLTPNRYNMVHELERSGRLEKFFISNSTPGFLPWRIAENCELLTQEFRLWRAATDPAERANIEETIVFVAGTLGHFVADAANPQHTTYNYNGWVEANPQHYATDCDTHFRFETRFVSTTMTSQLIYPALLPLQPRDVNYFDTALAFVEHSNSLVETLYRIDRDHGFDGYGTAEGRAFTVERLAAGASLLRDLWYSCYVNSAQPVKRRGAE